jgi:hypothetical protein
MAGHRHNPGDPRRHPRKRRTRQHVIADLSVNHVERHLLACGFSAERVGSDYGLDLIAFFFDRSGHPKPGRVMIQLKATDRISLRDKGESAACIVDVRDLHHWRELTEPVVLVLYDAGLDRAYWIYVQAHFADDAGIAGRAGGTVTVRIPVANQVGADAARAFEKFSDDVWRQQRGTIRYHD